MPIDRVEFLGVRFDRLSQQQVIERLGQISAESPFGYITTPNVDHVVRLNREGSEPAIKAAYAIADLCVCDSRVLAFLARLRGIRLPVVTGSDLTAALFGNVLRRGDRVAVIGGGGDLVRRLSGQYPHIDFVHYCPPMGLRNDVAAQAAAAAFITEAEARFTFLAVGSPQQELIAAQVKGAIGFGLCVGAALEFLTGDQIRAPKALRRTGLEWAYRLASDPRRLWRRYLVEGPRVFLLAWQWRAPTAGGGRRA